MHMKDNNSISIIQTKKPHVYDLYLQLPFQKRYVGAWDTAGDGCLIIKRKEEHLFRKNNSLGINAALLKDAGIRFKHIYIFYKGEKLYSTREYFLHYGKSFHFGSKNFEPQIFLEISKLNIKDVKEFERRNYKQADLFGAVA